MRGFGKSGAIDVGHEPELKRAIAEFAKRAVRHLWPKIRASDADVDHRFDFLSGVALPFAASHAIGECRHLVENRVYLRNDINAVHENLLRARSTKRHVKN